MKRKRSFQFGKTTLHSTSKPYVIAEIGVNHEGSMELAKSLVDLAREGGADAVKFQSYKADTLAAKKSPAYWDTSKESTLSQHELFKKYDNFNAEDYIELAEYSNSRNIDFLSTPFDDDSIEFLDPIVPFFKIASADITNIPFLRKIASKGKPVVLSTGASTLEEIDTAVVTLKDSGCSELALLHCILNYPTPYERANLKMINSLMQTYPEYLIGYSDHTLPDAEMTSLVTAFVLGAVVIEKHFTHDKTLPGNDHYHAMDIDDLKKFKQVTERIQLSLGDESIKEPIKEEAISRKHARRSIVLKSQINSGQVLDESVLTYKRPGSGISPFHWDEILGKKAIRDLDADHILQWSDLDNQ